MKAVPLTPLVSLFVVTPVLACTVWGATGEGITQTGATLVVKVRDEKPSLHTIKRISDGNGYSFEGIFTGKRQQFNTGINDKGLFIGRTTAGSVPTNIRREFKEWRSPERWHPHEYLIRRCASVKEALTHKEVFSGRHPVNYILADRTTVAVVECMSDGTFHVRTTHNGLLTHTNHYTALETASYNQSLGQSSLTRYDRINALLRNASKPYSFEQFIEFSKDSHNGPNDSIFRVGSSPEGTRTLCVIGARIPLQGAPTLYLRYKNNPADKNEAWKEVFLTQQ